MSEHMQEVEEKRARLREQLSEEAGLDEEQQVDEASLAPPGHLGERMNEGERRERSGS